MLKEISANEFNDYKNKKLVLVDFFSTTCGPCKMISFVLQDIAKEYGDELTILKIDFEQNPDLCKEYQVTGYPTLILFKDGQELKRMQGLQQKPKIIDMIKEAR